MPSPKETSRKKAGGKTPETVENHMISLAIVQAETQLQNGTAPAQIVTHFLKLGTERERLEREKLEHENELLKARTDALSSAANMEILLEQAISAMSSYKGVSSDDV